MTTTDELKSRPLPPGDFGLPLIGETIQFFRDPDFAQKRHQKHGSIFKTKLFGRPTVMISGSEANRFVFTHENQYFTSTFPPSTKILLGPASLAVQGGSNHLQRRKILSQAFQPRALAGYLTAMAEIAQGYLHKWEHLGTFTWYPELRKLTFDIACKLLVGLDAASETNLGQWFEEWCKGLFSIALPLPWTKFGRALHCRKQLLNQIEQIIRQRQQSSDPGQDALGLLLQARDEAGNSLSIEELKDQILLLLFAGHETLTSALASTCLLLAQHPDIVAAIRAEQQQLNLQRPWTMEDLKQMTYLEQVLKEVMRLIPPVGGGFREVIQSCELKGYQLPKGWSVQYQISRTHHDSDTYTQPEKFDPERFNPERAEDKSKPFSYVPFGGGVRECLGREFAKLEMKLFTALLVRDYQWELLPEQNLDMVVVPIPHPRDGLRVKFWRREAEN